MADSSHPPSTASPIRFSLLVPSYNRPDFLRETVQSLRAHRAPDVEIIVADDASPRRNEVHACIKDWIQSGDVRWIDQPKNCGWSRNRNTLVEAARGEYLILLGDDDRLKPHALARLREWTRREPSVDLFGMGFDVIDEKGHRRFTYCTPRPVLYQLAPQNPWRELFYWDAVPMWSHHPFTMCSRRTVARSLPYHPGVGVGDDALYLYQAIERGHRFLALPEVLFEWRNVFDRSGRYANLSSDAAKCAQSRALILAELSRTFAEHPPEIQGLLTSPIFLKRFLGLSGESLNQVADQVESGCVDTSSLIETARCAATQHQEGRLSKILRHLRATQVMGIGHWAQVLRYFHDKKRAGSVSTAE